MLGVVVWLGSFVALEALHLTIFDYRLQVLNALFPLPAAIDWVTQASGYRESRNWLRLLSGILLGASLTDLLASLVLAHWTFLLAGVVVFVVYVAGILLTLRVSGAWRKVILEHFPGTALE